MRRLWTAGVAALLVATACGSGGGSKPVETAAECDPVGAELEGQANQKFDVVLREFSIAPGALEARAGVVTFAVRNGGTEGHELGFLPGGGEVPFTADGKPDEDALKRAGAFELEPFGPDRSCKATFNLKPGRYTVFCLVTTDDGLTHYSKGMRGQLVVT